MPTRRTFLTAAGASFAAASLPPLVRAQPTPNKRLAIITTLWNYRSHSWHMAERFLRLPDALEPADVAKIIATANAAEPKLTKLVLGVLAGEKAH